MVGTIRGLAPARWGLIQRRFSMPDPFHFRNKENSEKAK
jgi:hypothetical protein